MMLMVMRMITQTTEGLDLSLIPRFEDGGAFLLENFWGCQFSLSLVQTVLVVFGPFPSNASCRRRPSPFILLLLNLELCMEPGLVFVSV
jgi:hypothetical protein